MRATPKQPASPAAGPSSPRIASRRSIVNLADAHTASTTPTETEAGPITHHHLHLNSPKLSPYARPTMRMRTPSNNASPAHSPALGTASAFSASPLAIPQPFMTSDRPAQTPMAANLSASGGDFFSVAPAAQPSPSWPADAQTFGSGSSGRSGSMSHLPSGPLTGGGGMSMPDLGAFASRMQVSMPMAGGFSVGSSPARATTLPSPGARKPSARHAESQQMSGISAGDLLGAMERDSHGAETVVLDLRPYTQYASAAGRIRGSINVCVPSTLLRRPNFTIERVAKTLSNPRDAEIFGRTLGGAKAQAKRIVVMDADSVALLTDAPLHSLLLKYERDGFAGELRWLRGGVSGLAALGPSNAFDGDALEITGETSSESPSRSPSTMSLSDASHPSSSRASFSADDSPAPVLFCRSLPAAAFQNASTQDHIVASMGMPTARAERQLSWSGSGSGDGSSSGDGYGALAANSRTDGVRRQAANPFYDNIRQNQEVRRCRIGQR